MKKWIYTIIYLFNFINKLVKYGVWYLFKDIVQG